jgi:hypothetical protein
MNPTMLGSIIRFAFADRKGWCVLVGTIKGRNQPLAAIRAGRP